MKIRFAIVNSDLLAQVRAEVDVLLHAVSSGDMDGDAFMLDISGRYSFTPTIFMEAGFQFMKIEVDGTQTQKYGWGIPLGTIDEEAESTQTSGFLSIGYMF